jgi:hypothetical protein
MSCFQEAEGRRELTEIICVDSVVYEPELLVARVDCWDDSTGDGRVKCEPEGEDEGVKSDAVGHAMVVEVKVAVTIMTPASTPEEKVMAARAETRDCRRNIARSKQKNERTDLNDPKEQ